MATPKKGETVTDKSGRRGVVIRVIKPGPYGRSLVRFGNGAPVVVPNTEI